MIPRRTTVPGTVSIPENTRCYNVPLAIASSLAASSVPALSAAYASGKRGEAKRQIGLATRFIMVVAFPCAVGMGVLASPILQMLFGDSSELAGKKAADRFRGHHFLLPVDPFHGLAAGDESDEGADQEAVIALALHLIILVALMLGLDLNIFAVIIANACFGLIMCILNARSIRRYSGYRQEVRRTFFVPGGFSGWNGRGGMACLPSVPLSASEQSDRNACIDCCRRLYLRDAAFDA